ncbi:DUF3846 domain-containing protein [Mycobacteroides abscessus]|uniref:DUF3846 domain-containing protein n=1 Tax=Mycobacteroides abscessus TaxID=36809 RepID=UPI000C264268|nr:DUF3846 domain-containing protein [Mycobacteroides abscessus]
MTVIKGVLIPADEDKPIELVEFDQSDLKAMQGYVGGWIQAVEGFRPPCTFIMNEEGKVNNLPLNRRGTLALWVHHAEFIDRDVLVGDVLLVGPADEETGDQLGVPDELVELLFNTEKYRYLVKTIGENGWHGNGIVLDDPWKAYNDALGLARRWTLVERVRVVAAA